MEILTSYFRRVNEIDPDDYGVNIGGFPIAQSGSSVYKGLCPNGESVAFKIYKKIIAGQIGVEELWKYQKIFKKVRDHLRGQQISLLRRDGKQDMYTLGVNLINKVGELKSTKEASSVSNFIEGPTLEEILNTYRYNSSSVVATLSKLSQELNDEVGTHGISIVPVNVKPVGEMLIITDIYAQIQKLREERI